MNKFDSRLKTAYIRIHQAIHDPGASTVELYPGGNRRPVHHMGSLRAVTYDDFTFMEQNPHKSTEFAKQARAGKHITWGIPVDGGVWLYIDDDIAEAFDNKSKQKINELYKQADEAIANIRVSMDNLRAQRAGGKRPGL